MLILALVLRDVLLEQLWLLILFQNISFKGCSVDHMMYRVLVLRDFLLSRLLVLRDIHIWILVLRDWVDKNGEHFCRRKYN